MKAFRGRTDPASVAPEFAMETGRRHRAHNTKPRMAMVADWKVPSQPRPSNTAAIFNRPPRPPRPDTAQYQHSSPAKRTVAYPSPRRNHISKRRSRSPENPPAKPITARSSAGQALFSPTSSTRSMREALRLDSQVGVAYRECKRAFAFAIYGLAGERAAFLLTSLAKSETDGTSATEYTVKPS